MITINLYNNSLAPQWDEVVRNSRNGTFLHLRGYMDYHSDRFNDFSLMACDGDKLIAIMPACREGDTVFIESYSRLARNTRDLLNIVDELEKKGVTVRSVKENFDTSTPQGRLMVTFMQGIAQFERDLIKERQAEGIAIAKEQGKFSKPTTPKPADWQDLYSKYKTRQMTATALAKQLGISRSLLYKWIREEA